MSIILYNKTNKTQTLGEYLLTVDIGNDNDNDESGFDAMFGDDSDDSESGFDAMFGNDNDNDNDSDDDYDDNDAICKTHKDFFTKDMNLNIKKLREILYLVSDKVFDFYTHDENENKLNDSEIFKDDILFEENNTTRKLTKNLNYDDFFEMQTYKYHTHKFNFSFDNVIKESDEKTGTLNLKNKNLKEYYDLMYNKDFFISISDKSPLFDAKIPNVPYKHIQKFQNDASKKRLIIADPVTKTIFSSNDSGNFKIEIFQHNKSVLEYVKSIFGDLNYNKERKIKEYEFFKNSHDIKIEKDLLSDTIDLCSQNLKIIMKQHDIEKISNNINTSNQKIRIFESVLKESSKYKNFANFKKKILVKYINKQETIYKKIKKDFFLSDKYSLENYKTEKKKQIENMKTGVKMAINLLRDILMSYNAIAIKITNPQQGDKYTLKLKGPSTNENFEKAFFATFSLIILQLEKEKTIITPNTIYMIKKDEDVEKNKDLSKNFGRSCQLKIRKPILITKEEESEITNKKMVLSLTDIMHYKCSNEKGYNYPVLLKNKAGKYYPCCFKKEQTSGKNKLKEFLNEIQTSDSRTIYLKKPDSILEYKRRGNLDELIKKKFKMVDYIRIGTSHPKSFVHSVLEALNYKGYIRNKETVYKNFIEENEIDKTKENKLFYIWTKMDEILRKDFKILVIRKEDPNNILSNSIPYKINIGIKNKNKKFIIIHINNKNENFDIISYKNKTIFNITESPFREIIKFYHSLWKFGNNKEIIDWIIENNHKIIKEVLDPITKKAYQYIVSTPDNDDYILPIFPEISMYTDGIKRIKTQQFQKPNLPKNLPKSYAIVHETEDKITFENGLVYWYNKSKSISKISKILERKNKRKKIIKGCSSEEWISPETGKKFMVCRTAPLGDCLYISLANGLHYLETGDIYPKDHPAQLADSNKLRKEAMVKLKQMKSTYPTWETIFGNVYALTETDEEGFDEFIEERSKKCVWGGYPEMVSLAYKYDVKIVSYGKTLDDDEKVFITNINDNAKNGTIYVLYNGIHFDSLFPIDDSDERVKFMNSHKHLGTIEDEYIREKYLNIYFDVHFNILNE